MLTCCVRCLLNWLGQITERCEKYMHACNRTRHRQLRNICFMELWLSHTWHYWWDTSCFSFFFWSACPLSLCQAYELMDETKAGEEVSVQRRRPQVWTGVWVHCHAGMGAVPGAQLRGVAHNHIYTQPPGLCWNTELLGKRERRAGWGYCINSISHCHNFEQGTLRKKRVSRAEGLRETEGGNREKSRGLEFFAKCGLSEHFCVCRCEWYVYI